MKHETTKPAAAFMFMKVWYNIIALHSPQIFLGDVAVGESLWAVGNQIGECVRVISLALETWESFVRLPSVDSSDHNEQFFAGQQQPSCQW